MKKKITTAAPQQNMSSLERVVSVGTGALMLYRALRKRSLVKGAGAGYMLYRGITGYCPVTDVLDGELQPGAVKKTNNQSD